MNCEELLQAARADVKWMKLELERLRKALTDQAVANRELWDEVERLKRSRSPRWEEDPALD